jgi:peptide deformylase
MPVLPIVRLGHPVLRAPAGPLAPELLADPEIQQLLDDMIETMKDARGVGLAAPQVGFGLQVFVYEAPPKNEGDEGVPLHVVINPMITPLSRELVYDWEGCLSIPDLRGLVPRHPQIRVQGLDRTGRPIDYIADAFEARIIQHENDHLNGVVFLDRMRDLKTLGYIDEWENYIAKESPENNEDATVA